MDFKVPSMVPQDLQIIQDLIGEIPEVEVRKTPSAEVVSQNNADESLDSSDNESDADSELEVEANILGRMDSDSERSPPTTTPTESTSDSESSSDSDSDSDDEGQPESKQSRAEDLAMDEDEEGGAVVSPDQVRTKNEVADVQVVIPEVEQVEEYETLEKVGEVFSIVDKVVIVKGGPQQVQGRVSDRALDSDTLLVFEDRKVLGYIWETFGPTSSPFYRVQFNDAYPLDTEKVRVAREVFHVPNRSKFVSVSYLKQRFRGSDASNAHDEEPAEDELEFSDDEAEREHKRALKERRGGMDPASRHTTPVPSHLRDADMADDLYGASTHDYSVNDMDFGAGPSRPPPMAYDDPYSDSYGLPDTSLPRASAAPTGANDAVPENSYGQDRPRGRGRGRGAARDGPSRDRGRGRGRDRPRDRGRGRGRGRGGGGGGGERDRWNGSAPHDGTGSSEGYNQPPARPLSPTSAAIARATGQYADNGTYATAQQQSAHGAQTAHAANEWGYQQYPGQADYNYGYQQPFVQPHINPRFASQFGMNLAYMQQMQYGGYGQYGMGYAAGGNASTGEWGDWQSASTTVTAQNPRDDGGHQQNESS